MKILQRTNYRIEVIPAEPYIWGEKTPEQIHERLMQATQDVAKQISRHVDDLENVQVEYDSDTVCEFCEEPWEASYDEGTMPECCDKAQDEWRSPSPAVQDVKPDSKEQ